MKFDYYTVPITPYHVIAGVAVKAISPKYFSWTVFVLANIAIDTEVLYYLITTGIASHRIFHTLIGATIIAIICASLGKYVCEIGLKALNYIIPNRISLLCFDRNTKINHTSAWSGAIIGAYSHIFLDSFVNIDMRPLFPFSDQNLLLGLISLQNMYYLCVSAFIIGIMIYFIKK